MRRLAFVLLSISILALSSHSVFACGGPCPMRYNASPETGVAPLSVKIYGYLGGDWIPRLDIDMGGEVTVARTFEFFFSDGTCGPGFTADHEFYCPGTYSIQAFDPADPNVATTATIKVLPPPGYYLFVFAGDTDHDVYVATHVSSSERPFSYSTVDWGDGTSETFAYTRRGLYAGTPNHSYAANGEYTATVKHHYEGQYCSWDQTETIVVKIPNVSLATNASTWGYVKSMYR